MRKTISISPAQLKKAKAIIRGRTFDGLSDMFSALIREEFERRFPEEFASELKEIAPEYKVSSIPEGGKKIAGAVRAEGQNVLKKTRKTKHT